VLYKITRTSLPFKVLIIWGVDPGWVEDSFASTEIEFRSCL